MAVRDAIRSRRRAAGGIEDRARRVVGDLAWGRIRPARRIERRRNRVARVVEDVGGGDAVLEDDVGPARRAGGVAGGEVVERVAAGRHGEGGGGELPHELEPQLAEGRDAERLERRVGVADVNVGERDAADADAAGVRQDVERDLGVRLVEADRPRPGPGDGAGGAGGRARRRGG